MKLSIAVANLWLWTMANKTVIRLLRKSFKLTDAKLSEGMLVSRKEKCSGVSPDL